MFYDFPDHGVAAAELLAAADHLRAVGLYQGGLYFAPLRETIDAPGVTTEPDVTKRPCCALGAISVAMDAIELVVVDPHQAATQEMRDLFTSEPFRARQEHFLQLRNAVEDTLQKTKRTRSHLTAWNDYSAAGADEVAELLEETAARLQAQADAEALFPAEVPC